ncbi:MAG TPA: hypothetical protein VI959_01915 [Alphaproteobacteria bacterium]|nr:hypothetical protein [Alphaproteobacteria bacterium]
MSCLFRAVMGTLLGNLMLASHGNEDVNFYLWFDYHSANPQVFCLQGQNFINYLNTAKYLPPVSIDTPLIYHAFEEVILNVKRGVFFERLILDLPQNLDYESFLKVFNPSKVRAYSLKIQGECVTEDFVKTVLTCPNFYSVREFYALDRVIDIHQYQDMCNLWD